MTTETTEKSFTITATLQYTVSMEIEAESEEDAKGKAWQFLEKCDLECPSEVDVLECPDIDITDVDE